MMLSCAVAANAAKAANKYLHSLDTDIINTYILSELNPGELLNYVLVSKEAYSKRDECIRSNRFTQGYDGDYFADLLNSHVTGFKDGCFTLTVPVRVNPVLVSNTYNLIVHAHQNGFVFPITEYFQDLIKAEYGYEADKTCEQLFASIYKTNWWNSNVNIYEVYKIIYHLTNKKHRHLGEALEAFAFVNKDQVLLKNTMDVIVSIYGPEHPNSRALRAIMFYLIYCYMEFLRPIMVDTKELAALTAGGSTSSTARYIQLAYVFYEKKDDVIKKLSEIVLLPDYIKNKMRKKYMQVFKILEEFV